MFLTDTTAVITQAKQGTFPSTWKVYRGNGNYGCANLGTLFALGFLIIFSVMFIKYPSIFFEELVFLGIPCVICAILARKWRMDVNASLSSILILLPEGVVQCFAGNLNNPAWLSYPNIRNIQFVQKTNVSGNEDGISTYNYYWLDVYGDDGNYYQFKISSVFGDQEFLCKTIIAAYNHYWSQN